MTDVQVNGPVEDVPLEDIVHRQEVVITVMRSRILELELELVHARCELLDHTHEVPLH